jgi:hypothetical protein
MNFYDYEVDSIFVYLNRVFSKAEIDFEDYRSVLTIMDKTDYILSLLDNFNISKIESSIKTKLTNFEYFEVLHKSLRFKRSQLDLQAIYSGKIEANKVFTEFDEDSSTTNCLLVDLKLKKYEFVLDITIMVRIHQNMPHIFLTMNLMDEPVFMLKKSSFNPYTEMKLHLIPDFFHWDCEKMIIYYNENCIMGKKLKLLMESLNQKSRRFVPIYDESKFRSPQDLANKFQDALKTIETFYPHSLKLLNIGNNLITRRLSKQNFQVGGPGDGNEPIMYDKFRRSLFFKNSRSGQKITPFHSIDSDKLIVGSYSTELIKLVPFLKLFDTSTQDQLSVARIYNEDVKQSFWNFFCGEILDYRLETVEDAETYLNIKLEKPIGDFFALLISIYSNLCSYILGASNVVLDYMENAMKIYMNMFFSKITDFRKFLDFIQSEIHFLNDKSYNEMNNLQVTTEILQNLCDTLNIDLNMYQLTSLTNCLDSTAFNVSRSHRFQSLMSFTLRPDEFGSYQIHKNPGLKRTSDFQASKIEKRFVRYRGRELDWMRDKKLEIVGKYSTMKDILESVISDSTRDLTLHDVMKQTLMSLEKLADFENIGNVQHETVEPDVPPNWKGLNTFRTFYESCSMSQYKAQLFIHLLLVSHYHDIETFYNSDEYLTSDTKPQFSTNHDNLPFNRMNYLDFWKLYLHYIKFYFEDYALHAIDLELLAQRLDLNIVCLVTNSLHRDMTPLCHLKYSNLDANFNKVPSHLWFSNTRVNWSFGLEEDDSHYEDFSQITKTLVVVLDNTRMSGFRLIHQKSLTIEQNPNLFQKFQVVKTLSFLKDLRYKTYFEKDTRIPHKFFDGDIFRSKDNIISEIKKFFKWDVFLFKTQDQKYYTLKHRFLLEIDRFDPEYEYDKDTILNEWDNLMSIFGSKPDPLFELATYYAAELSMNLLNIIAMVFEERIIICVCSAGEKKIFPESFFTFDKIIDFNYMVLDEESELEQAVMSKECLILIKRDVFMKIDDEDKEEDVKDLKTSIIFQGLLPPFAYIPLKFGIEPSEEDKKIENVEDIQNNTETRERSSSLGARFEKNTEKIDVRAIQTLGAKKSSSDNPSVKIQFINPLPIHVLATDANDKNLLEWEKDTDYASMLFRNTFQPILITHRSIPSAIKNYSLRCFTTIKKTKDEPNWENSDNFKFIKPDAKIDESQYHEMYFFKEVMETYNDEKLNGKKISIDLTKKIEPSNFFDGKVKGWNDLIKSIRITMACTNSHHKPNVASKFFSSIARSSQGNLQKLFEIFSDTYISYQSDRDIFAVSRDKKSFSVCCRGIWDHFNVKLTVAMQLVCFFIVYLEHPTNRKTNFYERNEYDNQILEMLKRVRTKWYEHGQARDKKGNIPEKPNAVNSTDAYLVPLDDDLYDKSKKMNMEDIRVMSIIYHLEFRVVEQFGKYESNSFIDEQYTSFLQFTRPRKGTKVSEGKVKVDNFVKEIKKDGKIITITERLYRDINFPPWVDDFTDLELIPNLLYSKDRKTKVRSFKNHPRLQIFLFDDPMSLDNKTEYYGYLLLKGNHVNVQNYRIQGDIRDMNEKEKSENKVLIIYKSSGGGGGGGKGKEGKQKNDDDDDDIDGAHNGGCSNKNRKRAKKDDDDEEKHEGKRKGTRNTDRQENFYRGTDGRVYGVDRHGRKHKTNMYADSKFTLGDSFNFTQHQQNRTVWAEGENKEIHMLSYSLAMTIAFLERLKDNGFMTTKLNKGVTTQSRLIANMLMPCFKSVTAYPVSNFTDHILFAGKGFSRENMEKFNVLERLQGCMDLSEFSVFREYEQLRDDYTDRKRWDAFEKRVASCSEKLMHDNIFNLFKTAQVMMEGALSSEIKVGSGTQSWLTPELTSALNHVVFRNISEEDRLKNQKIVVAIMESPLGDQLRAVFDPVILKIHPVNRSIEAPLYDDDTYDSDEFI